MSRIKNPTAPAIQYFKLCWVLKDKNPRHSFLPTPQSPAPEGLIKFPSGKGRGCPLLN
ncbi:hypothetical protein KsCSTR_17110 [Candidatus Kuenenia stuttgartiensis]|uniref:Uncharacterized protein n=1 Tax=Kuenenia stuttgartiensis TaxID=174633 RepID=Q1Q229_KUEST|nr:hypothetical protein KsCSTR_17110 [Candidatus Kuenenia stuttgartiensis]CAJ74059.1 unknown protein [Candidatus Kuenenia stuttgartiensis]